MARSKRVEPLCKSVRPKLPYQWHERRTWASTFACACGVGAHVGRTLMSSQVWLGPWGTRRAVSQTDPEWDPPPEQSFRGLCVSFSSSVTSPALSPSVLPLRMARGWLRHAGAFILRYLNLEAFPKWAFLCEEVRWELFNQGIALEGFWKNSFHVCFSLITKITYDLYVCVCFAYARI